jgi:hypothetical protein
VPLAFGVRRFSTGFVRRSVVECLCVASHYLSSRTGACAGRARRGACPAIESVATFAPSCVPLPRVVKMFHVVRSIAEIDAHMVKRVIPNRTFDGRDRQSAESRTPELGGRRGIQKPQYVL